MMRSTTRDKQPSDKVKPWAAVFWLAVWEIAAVLVGHELLLVSPLKVAARLFELAAQAAFWRAVFFSFFRIVAGFMTACVLGTLLAAAAFRFSRARELITPLMLVIKATPVASFIILVLIWIPSRGLSAFISFLMVLPIIYSNVLTGIQAADPLLLQMSGLFALSWGRKLRYIYFSQVLPYFTAGCSVALGLCWKAGVAAEIIGVPKGSIGENLYNAKIYLDTPDLFAWTLVIILISQLFERAFLTGVRGFTRRMERL